MCWVCWPWSVWASWSYCEERVTGVCGSITGIGGRFSRSSGDVRRCDRRLTVDHQRTLGAVEQCRPAAVAQCRADAARHLMAARRPARQRDGAVDQGQRGAAQLDRRQIGVRHPGAGVLDEGVLVGFRRQRLRELLGQVDRARDLHGVWRRAVDGNVGRLVGGRVDAKAGACGPHLRLVDVGDLALERQLLVVRPRQLQTAQHASLTRLPPRLVTRPQHADGEPAVRVEAGAEVALHGGRALLLADLLDPGGRRRRRVGAVLAAGERAHVHRLGDLEAVLVLAVDDLGRVRRAVRPVQAVAALGVVERVVAAGAERDRAGGQPVGAVPARQCGDEPGDEQTTQRGQQQRAARRRSVQTLPPRHPLRRLRPRLVRVSEQWLALGCLQHPLHCDRRVRRCDK